MRRLYFILALLASLTVIGTVGFRLIEGRPWIESAYLAIITLTTLGSRDPAETNAEMIFVMFYMFVGLGLFSYSLFSLGQIFVDARLNRHWRKRQMEKRIRAMNGHYIVCGQGRMGQTICEFLQHRHKSFVVVDLDEERLVHNCEENQWPYVVGDATDDNVLLEAGIENASALATALATDSDNVYVVLSAKMLNPDLQIVARASDDKAVEKMERAGATRVISPFSSGAVKMARFMINPSVEDFLEIADDKGHELEIADVLVDDNSPYAGKSLMETDLRDKGVMVIGIRKKSGERLMPPPGSAVLDEGDNLFVFGSSTAINEIIDGSADST